MRLRSCIVMIVIVTLSLSLFTSGALAAGIGSLGAIADSTIRQGTDPFTGNVYDDDNFGSYHELVVGKFWYKGKVYYRARIVLNFDVSSISCPVSKAELVLTARSGIDVTLRVFPLKEGFVESEVTWERAKVGDPWNGGEYDTTEQLDYSHFSALLPGDEVRFDVTEWVRSVKRGSPAYGLIIDSGGSDGNASFYSRESA
ncbi:MAG TPA: DNRLRE domain-containing protein, partial [Candidatus Korarchaeota archaeon]|nr:DNRLRE domain-containing protein [Candidatus Korarchaeota archaeon]